MKMLIHLYFICVIYPHEGQKQITHIIDSRETNLKRLRVTADLCDHPWLKKHRTFVGNMKLALGIETSTTMQQRVLDDTLFMKNWYLIITTCFPCFLKSISSKTWDLQRFLSKYMLYLKLDKNNPTPPRKTSTMAKNLQTYVSCFVEAILRYSFSLPKL